MQALHKSVCTVISPAIPPVKASIFTADMMAVTGGACPGDYGVWCGFSAYADSVDGSGLCTHEHDSHLAFTTEEGQTTALLHLLRDLTRVALEEQARKEAYK